MPRDLRDAGQRGAVVGQEVPAETAQITNTHPNERHSPPGDRSSMPWTLKPGETDLRKTLETLCNKENEPMTDEIDEITNRSWTSRASTLNVYGRQHPEPAVVLILRFNRGDGVIDTIRLAQPAPQRRARGCSDFLLGTADAVTLQALADGGDREAAELLAEMKRQLEEAEPIPEWYQDLDH